MGTSTKKMAYLSKTLNMFTKLSHLAAYHKNTIYINLFLIHDLFIIHDLLIMHDESKLGLLIIM